MISRRIKNELRSLPIHDKITGIAILITGISVVFPWYQESDAWGGSPEKYLGVTGPLYLIGWVIVLISAATLYFFYRQVIRKEELKLPFENNLAYLLSGALILFFNILTYSIYFHNKFGINPFRKEARFGMFAVFFGASLLLVGGYLKNKKTAGEYNPYIIESSVSKPKNLSTPTETREQRKVAPAYSQKSSQTPEEQKEVINLKMNL